MTTWNRMQAVNVRHRMAEKGIRDAKELAEIITSIPHGTLRNAVSGLDPMRLDRIYTVARALVRDGENLRDCVADILAGTNDGVPDEPPKQPKRPPAPPKRQDREPSKGPKRATGTAA